MPGRRLVRQWSLKGAVLACAVSPDGRRLAYTGGPGHDVIVQRFDTPNSSLPLGGGVQVDAVGFTRDRPRYRLAFQTSPHPKWDEGIRCFDAEHLQFDLVGKEVPRSIPSCGGWQATLDENNNRLWLYQQGIGCGAIVLDGESQGIVQSFCWIPDADGRAAAVAVGTNVQCGVYVYGLGDPSYPLLLYFRGHHAQVTSLAVSPDRKYLVSGSRDGSVRYWELKGLEWPQLRRRWGGVFAEQDGRLMVQAVDGCGPLDHRHVRPGDEITAILWPDRGQVRSAENAREILTRLEQLPWNIQVSFKTTRKGAARPPFNLVAGWQELLSLYTNDQDWIAWTPDGYYACSLNGERLIGWQVSNQPGKPAPSFFSAEKYKKSLYQPDIIRTLLEKGGPFARGGRTVAAGETAGEDRGPQTAGPARGFHGGDGRGRGPRSLAAGSHATAGGRPALRSPARGGSLGGEKEAGKLAAKACTGGASRRGASRKPAKLRV